MDLDDKIKGLFDKKNFYFFEALRRKVFVGQRFSFYTSFICVCVGFLNYSYGVQLGSRVLVFLGIGMFLLGSFFLIRCFELNKKADDLGEVVMKLK